MTKINTYGINIKGLKKASGATDNYGAYSPEYNEIFYNRESGEVWTVHQCTGRNNYTVYDDSAIIKVCDTTHRMSMQDIANQIKHRLDYLDNIRRI